MTFPGDWMDDDEWPRITSRPWRHGDAACQGCEDRSEDVMVAHVGSSEIRLCRECAGKAFPRRLIKRRAS